MSQPSEIFACREGKDGVLVYESGSRSYGGSRLSQGQKRRPFRHGLREEGVTKTTGRAHLEPEIN